MPSMISSRRSRARPKLPTTSVKASATGCCGVPVKIAATSVRHQASYIRASAGSVLSSTTSSTSRQKA